MMVGRTDISPWKGDLGLPQIKSICQHMKCLCQAFSWSMIGGIMQNVGLCCLSLQIFWQKACSHAIFTWFKGLFSCMRCILLASPVWQHSANFKVLFQKSHWRLRSRTGLHQERPCTNCNRGTRVTAVGKGTQIT